MSLRPYHHGNLRAALLECGLVLLATRPADELSLREVARAAGVSANAVYRHFPDKRALMVGLAAEGFRLLGESQRMAAAAVHGGTAGFEATGRAYVRFALANPALFRLMFANPAPPDLLSRPASETMDAMAFLRANAEEAAGGRHDATLVAVQAWSMAHGLALLMLDRQIPADEAVIDGVFDLWSGIVATAQNAPGRT